MTGRAQEQGQTVRGGERQGREERLQKVLAARGVASRRAAEELIREGRVSVDGRVVLELGTKVDPERATIRVNGRPLGRPRPVYLLLNKPRGYLTTASDPEGRRTVYDLLDTKERVFPVGRLDMDSEGLLLLTNDGELANHIAHPRYRIDKEYHALVEGTPTPQQLDHLRRGGLPLDGRRTSPAEIGVLERGPEGTWLRVVIHEGRKRQVRRMLEEVGHPVRRLRRVRLGPLTLAGLPAAAHRPLTAPELARLRRLLGLAPGEGGEMAAEVAPAEGQTRRPPTPGGRAAREGGKRPGDSRPVRPARSPAGADRRDGGTKRGGGRRRNEQQAGNGGRGGAGGRGGTRGETQGRRPRPPRRGTP